MMTLKDVQDLERELYAKLDRSLDETRLLEAVRFLLDTGQFRPYVNADYTLTRKFPTA